MRILVVEDNPDVRQCLVAGLELRGHRVLEAVTLTEAQAIIADHAIEAVIADGQFPSAEGKLPAPYGFSIVQDCRWRGVAAVLYTADADLVDRARMTGIPALAKPATTEEILALLEAQCSVAR